MCLSTARLPISEHSHLISFQSFLEILTQLGKYEFLSGRGRENLVEEVGRGERGGAKFLRGERGDEGGRGDVGTDTHENLEGLF
jgi:hypothetical protein